ncbi:2-hydroxycyclohexanecarboxyl-CoA dehydrogenase [Calocera viscosa TUFC12733]|uniref:2-hydroxycyclohexanecarboxyl-CoA dehydrogenase n=1 Tax=Calocera viscosa (strain TUFC12733) TaxID=1330018 RepID=A0A167PJY8_CALVF|nr:2-hydroxycyclohexanecarboxyl-CoA dehydrogenase [Calocera viscosa TUFC12733]
MPIPNESSSPSLRHLVGKLVVVVGGSSGMGFAVARSSLEQGAKVIIASSNKAKVDAAVTRLIQANSAFKGSVSGLTVDAKDVPSLEKFWDEVGKFDHLVWTAGDSLGMPNFLTDDLTKKLNQPDVRMFGAAFSVQYAQKMDLFNPGASVTLTGGYVAHKPRKGWTMEVAGAGAIEALTRGLALEVAPVRVNSIGSGSVETEMWAAAGPQVVEYLKAAAIQGSPLQHCGQPEEIAEAYLFMMKCPMMTGSTVYVESGALLI